MTDRPTTSTAPTGAGREGRVQAAIDAEVARNERLVSRGTLFTAALGTVLLLAMMATVHAGAPFRVSTGPHLLVLTFLLGAWSSAAIALLRRGVAIAWVRRANGLVEASFPCLVMLVESRSEPAAFVAYASLGGTPGSP